MRSSQAVHDVAKLGNVRIAITGGPGVGKSTFALDLSSLTGADVKHGDRVMDLGWHESSAAVSHWFDAEGPFIVEGVVVPRALRKWLDTHPEGKPVDVLLFRSETFKTLNQGQTTMGKGVKSVLKDIFPELIRRGVKVISG